MITARELKDVSETCQSRIDAILARIEPELVKRAEAGFRDYTCYREVPWESSNTYTTPPVTLFQQRVIDELKKYGYHAKVEPHGEPYVPRAYEDDDNAQKIQNHVLVIRW